MRNNQPVTQREFHYSDDATLMSTTDTASHITYVNDAFAAVSGMDREQIIGQPHNVVRHPDMPQEAFADMWSTLQGGAPWTSLIKNRCQDGDHYWVRANAIPLIRNGQTTGYMSVQTKPTSQEAEKAEALYRALREGKAGSRKLYKGLLVRTGWRVLLSWQQTLSMRGRIRLTMAGMWLTLATFGLLLNGIAGLTRTTIVGAVVASALSWLLERQFARPMELLYRQTLGVATGDNRDFVHMDRVDEIGLTLRSVSQLGLMFRWLVDDVSQQIMSVQTAATEIAQGNHDLSARTEQAAANVEETAASMEQMAATVRNNTETSAQAEQLVRSASAAAAEGGRVMVDVVATMADISASSKKIADIIGVIDGIAFQTNILALNAAVEAARAGEQGRGFSVVAGEVRSLAQRSAEAAKEIRTLITASVDKVETGATLVNDAGRSMDDIVAQVQRVSNLIGSISAATQEQAGGVSQISEAIAHLDQITQQNAALVEQNAAASQSLQDQMDHLAVAVGVFN